MVNSEQPTPAKKIKTSASKPKRQREVENTAATEDEQAPPPKKSKMAPKNVINNPDVSPRRSGRAQTKAPAAPQRRKRRTKEEMAADKANAEAEKRRQEELTQERHHAMMQMDINEDVDRAETAARTIRTFADLDRDTESDVEIFVGYNDIFSSDDSDSGPAEETVKLKGTKKAKALPKAKVDGSKRNGASGKKINKQITFASGLRQDWKSTVREYPKTRTPFIQISAGGLDESDVEDASPCPSPPKSYTLTEEEVTEGARKAKRDLSRRNEMVSIAENNDEEEYIPRHGARKAMAKITRPRLGQQVKSEKNNEGSMPVTTAVTTSKTKTKAKLPKRLNGNNVRITDLPEFTQGKWRTTFLPTLYDKFFASDQPFENFSTGSDQFVALLQSVIDEVYINVDYEVTSSDSIHFLAYNRINEKRSSIGSNVIKMVKNHIKTLNGGDAKDWLRWSLRGDGPLFFKVPSPMGSTTNQTDPKYQFPEGRLLSQFVTGLATPLLSLRTGSASKNGYPKALIALIMAALERAVRYLSKPSTEPKEFLKEFWGSKVRSYYDGFHGENGVPDTRWDKLVDICGGHSGDCSADDTLEADLSILDNDRPFIFNFRSPVKTRA